MFNRNDFLEEIFSSRGRTRVLRIMVQEKELNLTQLVKKSMLNYATVTKHLDKLMQYGIVSERRFGNIKMFQLETNSQLASKIMELIAIANQGQRSRSPEASFRAS